VNERARGLLFLVLLCALVVAADQYSKHLAISYLRQNDARELTSYFNLVLAFNPGAAFGILSTLATGTRRIVLGATTLIALGVVISLALSPAYKSKIARAALALILGGALGNIIDRFRLGVVVDFLDFHWQAWHWPAFNLADSSICVGVAVLLFCRAPKAAKAAPADEELPPTAA
jgi:signal peptidase II